MQVFQNFQTFYFFSLLFALIASVLANPIPRGEVGSVICGKFDLRKDYRNVAIKGHLPGLIKGIPGEVVSSSSVYSWANGDRVEKYREEENLPRTRVQVDQ